MKVKIDSRKISSSSNLVNQDIKFDETVDEIIDQLKQQLLFGNKSCFLISGYRGTGKTTLIRRLEDKIKDDNIIFVYLNFSKYENYSMVLRKLIREIYLTLSSSKRYKLIKDKQLVDSIELLYDHTFYEVFSSSNIKNLKEFSSKLEGKFNVKDLAENLLPLIAVVFSSLNISFNILPVLLKNSNIAILVLSICWLIRNTLKLKLEIQRKKTSIEELNRKSLYDDEIAEYHLRNMLEGLNNEEIKITFVFDELDKIENEAEMESIISDLKPLLLSNLASFIVISGQKLYYKFLNSSILDDSIMTSIFSKNIHIPLATNIHLEKFFNSYIIDYIYINDELLKKYRDSLILNSYRTMRRFNNLILQDIEWDKDEAYLYIEEDNIDSYKTDSIILNILTQIIETNIDTADYDNGIKDFLTYQLFIWIKKMKLKGKIYFTNREIYNFEENYSEIYPVWCKYELNELCTELMSNLLNTGLIEKKVNNNEEEIYYRWTKQANIKIDGFNNDQSKGEIRFLEEMIELEKYCRDILIDLEGNNNQNRQPRNVIQLIRELTDIGVIEDGENYKEKELYRLSNKIRHGEILSKKDIDNIIQNTSYIRMLKYKLIEGYSFYVINRYLIDFGYNVYKNRLLKVNSSINEVDIIAESDTLGKGNIIFEIKHKNNYSNNDINSIHRLLELLNEYNFVTQKRNKLVLFWFSKESRKPFEKFKDAINKVIINEYNDLYEDIYLFYASEHRTNFSSRRMEAYLNKVIKPPMVDYKNEVAVSNDENI